MTTDELIEQLRELDPGGKLEVICTRCSDYQDMTPDDVSVVRAVRKSSACYVMRPHHTMSPEDLAAARDFIHFTGN
jgi:hypothetical protein